MAFIISQSTFITGLGARGYTSINLSLTPQIQRLYDIGYSDPFDTDTIQQHSLSVTRYAPGPTYSTLPSVNCEDANSLRITISANACGSAEGVHISEDFFVNNYSYSKDMQGFGQETWSMVTRPLPSSGLDFIMIRGISEGQTTRSLPSGHNTGIQLGEAIITGKEISVTAGNPGIGQADEVIFGMVTQVGGGTGKFDGYVGNGQVNIPYTPIPDLS